jgi:hypothetical protein
MITPVFILICVFLSAILLFVLVACILPIIGIILESIGEFKRKTTAYPLPDISIMPLIGYTCNTNKKINLYTKNKYILSKM